MTCSMATGVPYAAYGFTSLIARPLTPLSARCDGPDAVLRVPI